MLRQGTAADFDNELIVALMSFPSDGSASDFARRIVEKQIAACVHILPAGRSFYRWDGQLQNDSECLLLVKTTRSLFDSLEFFVKQHHPYKVPELIAIRAEAVSAAYLDWVRGEVAAISKGSLRA